MGNDQARVEGKSIQLMHGCGGSASTSALLVLLMWSNRTGAWVVAEERLRSRREEGF